MHFTRIEVNLIFVRASIKNSVCSFVICLLAAALLSACSSARGATLHDLAAPVNVAPGLFGALELKYGGDARLPQWERVQQEMITERAKFRACKSRQQDCYSPALIQWKDLIRTNGNLPLPQKLQAVNRFFNRWPYRTDMELYGISEYWAGPFTFMRNSGDCEDYAIAKYVTLEFLNVPREKMRIVTVHDKLRGIGHAVLAVYDEADILILDSLSDGVFSEKQYRQYDPKYAVNDSGRWIYVTPQDTHTNSTRTQP